MGFEIWSGSDQYRFGQFEWRTLADYSRHVAPRLTSVCRHWYTNDGDGLNANLARELGAELQHSVDTCSIDDYARQLFAVLCKENSVPDFALRGRVRLW